MLLIYISLYIICLHICLFNLTDESFLIIINQSILAKIYKLKVVKLLVCSVRGKKNTTSTASQAQRGKFNGRIHYVNYTVFIDYLFSKSLIATRILQYLSGPVLPTQPSTRFSQSKTTVSKVTSIVKICIESEL